MPLKRLHRELAHQTRTNLLGRLVYLTVRIAEAPAFGPVFTGMALEAECIRSFLRLHDTNGAAA
jgi:hypothetical protein